MAVLMIACLRRLGQERFITKSRHYKIEPRQSARMQRTPEIVSPL
jgi:hypothetical protein